MSEYEENEIYQKLKCVIDNEKTHKIEILPWIRRFYRKLSVRRLKRNAGMQKPFDVDSFSAENWKQETTVNVLDRYCQLISSSSNAKKSFHACLAGSISFDLFESPHTRRVLHPFIYRNKKCLPQWVKVKSNDGACFASN